MNSRILVTGSSGLVGGAVRTALENSGIAVTGRDIRASGEDFGDVRDAQAMTRALDGCTGIIHFAAVSRVVWGERDPDNCWDVNVNGLSNLIRLAQAQITRPWLIFASSREVYGQPAVLPASEDAPLSPVNIYGRSKVEGERLIEEAQANGLRAVVIRLSNVYGSTKDHHDRVVPAFARAAVRGHSLRVDGSNHTFDFTHIDDTVQGIVALAAHLEANHEVPPPIHFLTGQATSLGQLAGMAKEIANSASDIVHAPPRNFDVSQFHGNPLRAQELLGWKSRVSIREGLGRLIKDFRSELHAENC